MERLNGQPKMPEIPKDAPQLTVVFDVESQSAMVKWENVKNLDFGIAILQQGISAIDKLKKDNEMMARAQMAQQAMMDQQMANKIIRGK